MGEVRGLAEGGHDFFGEKAHGLEDGARGHSTAVEDEAEGGDVRGVLVALQLLDHGWWGAGERSVLEHLFEIGFAFEWERFGDARDDVFAAESEVGGLSGLVEEVLHLGARFVIGRGDDNLALDAEFRRGGRVAFT